MKPRIELQVCIGDSPHARPISGTNCANDNIPREQELFEACAARELGDDIDEPTTH